MKVKEKKKYVDVRSYDHGMRARRITDTRVVIGKDYNRLNDDPMHLQRSWSMGRLSGQSLTLHPWREWSSSPLILTREYQYIAKIIVRSNTPYSSFLHYMFSSLIAEYKIVFNSFQCHFVTISYASSHHEWCWHNRISSRVVSTWSTLRMMNVVPEWYSYSTVYVLITIRPHHPSVWVLLMYHTSMLHRHIRWSRSIGRIEKCIILIFVNSISSIASIPFLIVIRTIGTSHLVTSSCPMSIMSVIQSKWYHKLSIS